MKRKLPSWMILTLVAVVIAGLLGTINHLTAEPIAQRADEEAYAARKVAYDTADDFKQIEIPEGSSVDSCYEAYSNGELVGYVVQVTAGGCQGPIEIQAGIDLDGNVMAISCGGQKFQETAGLGDKVRTPEFQGQFAGKSIPITLGTDVDAISGATISSGAVVNGVNTAGYFVQELLNPSAPLNLPEDQQFGGVLPGATTKQEEKAPDGIDELYSSDAGCVVYVTGNGRNGPIQVQVGVAHSGQVAGIYIDPAKHSETEGLGDAIENSYFLNRFLGKSAPFTVGENIDAISGATISSTAVIDCVNRAVEAATPFLDPSRAEDISSWFAGVDAGDLPAIVAERKAEVVQTGSGVTLLSAKDWETEYPEIYASYMRNGENDEVVDYVKEYPMIGTLFEGYGFAKYYGSARGHAYVIEDVTSTGRPHAMANCFTCKTPNFTALANEMGDAAYSLPFEDVLQDVNEPLSCYNCHGNNAPTLTLTHTYLADAMGEDLENVDARNLVCAQCHVDYYFHPETKATTLPYANLEGIHPDEMLAYYNSYLVDGKPYADYVNPRTGVRQIMVNHPEMETFLSEGSVHRDKFTCADCHMGTATAADGTTYKNHMLTSPLDNEDLLANTCSQCHSDLKSEVAAIQEEAERRTYAIGYELELLTEKLAAAVESGDYTEQELDAIRSLARDGQFYWNFVFVENSEGAHNSKLTTYCLNKSEELVNQALGMFK